MKPILIKLNGPKEDPLELFYPIGINLEQIHIYTDDIKQRIIELFKDDNICFISKGISGAIITGILCNKLHNIYPTTDYRIVIARKKDEKCHSLNLQGLDTCCNLDKFGEYPYRFIVIDDFICTGETIASIIKDVKWYFNIIKCEFPIMDALIIANACSGVTEECLYKTDDIAESLFKNFIYIISY